MTTLIVKHGRTDVIVEGVNSETTLEELCEKVQQQTGLDGGDLKLLAAGKNLLGANGRPLTSTLGSLPKGLNTKMVVMGTTKTAIASLTHCPPCSQMKRVINDLGAVPNDGKSNGAFSSHSSVVRSEYCFESIHTLPGLPDEAKARAILEELANDIGILATMKKYKFKVGQLFEMFPEGMVGVDPVCVLGLNTNFGARIQLRLRTDDLEGFRKMDSIRKVLYHELAHNVHGEHDSKFYMLMRQIEKDVKALDWRTSKGHHVGGNVGGVSSATVGTAAATAAATAAGSSGSTGRKLGGESEVNGLTTIFSARTMAGLAAVMRLTDEEQEVERGCGGSGENGAMARVADSPTSADTPVDSSNSSSDSNSDSNLKSNSDNQQATKMHES